MRLAKRRITQHKRFMSYGTHPNPALLKSVGAEKCWASFMLILLYQLS